MCSACSGDYEDPCAADELRVPADDDSPLWAWWKASDREQETGREIEEQPAEAEKRQAESLS